MGAPLASSASTAGDAAGVGGNSRPARRKASFTGKNQTANREASARAARSGPIEVARKILAPTARNGNTPRSIQ
jgi:hypothetical protein